MGWNNEEVDFNIRETGVKHVYKSDSKSYIAFAYPAILGKLKHIYQNGLNQFDLIDVFQQSEVEKDGVKLYVYKWPARIIAGEDTFEFLWKDK